MKIVLVAMALISMATGCFAACGGVDLRSSLSEAAQADIQNAVANEPFAVGNFWRATRGNRDIILLGTIHIDDPRLDAIAAQFDPLISDADTVFLEMTTREQSALQTRLAEDPTMIVLPEGSLIDLLQADQWSQLAEAAAARGLPGPMAARLQPWYLSLVLALPPCLLVDGAIPEGLDKRIEQRANAAGIPTQALEPYDTLFHLFAEEPLDVQIDLLTASVLDDASAENMLLTTRALYFEEAPAELWHVSRIAARDQLALPIEDIDAMFDGLQDTLLVKRNRAWVTLLDAQTNQNIVAAFGAAHMFGQEGVPALLQDLGYTLTRLTP